VRLAESHLTSDTLLVPSPLDAGTQQLRFRLQIIKI